MRGRICIAGTPSFLQRSGSLRTWWRHARGHLAESSEGQSDDINYHSNAVIRKRRPEVCCDYDSLGSDVGGAIDSGVVTYSVNGAQKVTVATGFTRAKS